MLRFAARFLTLSTVLFCVATHAQTASTDEAYVALAKFSGGATSRGVILRWVTTVEKNNSGFEIERSEDNVNFETIAFIKGNGTTAEMKQYGFFDRGAYGRVYYRLKRISYDGSFEYLPILEVEARVPKALSMK